METELKKQSILIVDDEPINIQLLGQALTTQYTIKTATSGHKALDIIQSADKPDLILLDIKMPDLDGYQVLAQIKSDESTQKIPVIFITSTDDADEEAKGLNLGAMDYITKPFNTTVVHARVRNQLALKQKSDLLEQLVSMDGLTEISNRRFYDVMLQTEWRRCNRSGVALSVIMIDIDCFKQFNDNYGHTEGDSALKKVAKHLNNACRRSGDLVARYGGEEFVALLPDTNYEAAKHVANNMKQAIIDLNITHEFSTTANTLTISLGVASTYPGLDNCAIELQSTADKMLYKAKLQGKNTIEKIEL